MSSKGPAWVDDLEALLRDFGACYHRREAALKRAARFRTYQEAWDAEEHFDDLGFLVSVLDLNWDRWHRAKTNKAVKYHSAYWELACQYDGRTRKALSKARCELYRKFWPNPPKLPKAKPIKTGR